MVKISITIAEPRDILREGLRTIFQDDHRVSHIDLVTNERELYAHLDKTRSDLVLVNQSLITEITQLPTQNVTILADEPNLELLKTAYKHGVRGYVSTSVSADFLRALLLDLENDTFILEPSLVSWVMENLFDSSNISVKEDLLTPREKEIVDLLKEGHDRPSIARKLCIAETTLKTHIKNIYKKRRRFSYPKVASKSFDEID